MGVLPFALLCFVLLVAFARARPKHVATVVFLLGLVSVFLAMRGYAPLAILACLAAGWVWLQERRHAKAAGANDGVELNAKTPPYATERTQAWQILGLTPGASRDDIISAHRRLIAALHPDQGGSSFLAAQINRARDILLK